MFSATIASSSTIMIDFVPCISRIVIPARRYCKLIPRLGLVEKQVMRRFIILCLVFAPGMLIGPAFGDPLETLVTADAATVRRELGRIRAATARDAFLWTPLMRAAAENPHPETIAMLLNQGEVIDARSLDDWDALMFAAAFNQEPGVTQVLLEAGLNPNGRTRDAWVVGYGFARFTGEIVQIGDLGFGRDAPGTQEQGTREQHRGWTPLFFAARYNDEPAVVQVLLEGGADPDARDEHGLTPLDYARQGGNQEIIRLLEHSAPTQ